MRCVLVLVLVATAVLAAPYEQRKHEEVLPGRVWMTDAVMGNDMKVADGSKDRNKRWYSFANPSGKQWPGGVLIYDLDPAGEMTSQQKQNVLNAFNEIQKLTVIDGGNCVTFKRRTTEQTGYLKIVLHNNMCSCEAGYPEGKIHTMTLQKTWCIGSKKTIMHEALHGFGFGHEQVRPDRDNYVYDQPGTERPYKWSAVSTQCLPYDYVSVMHYDGWKAKDSSVRCVGSHCSPTLSTLDIKRIQMRYGCIPTPDYCKEGLDMTQWGGKPTGGSTGGTGGTGGAGGTGGIHKTTVSTGTNYDVNANAYKYFKVTGKNSIAFTLKASNDAHVALSTYQDDSRNTYEIVFGGWGNTRSCIRIQKQGHCYAYVETARILNALQDREFWISWQNGNIRVGKGLSVGQNSFMEYSHSPPYQVSYLGVATGWGSNGEWKFY